MASEIRVNKINSRTGVGTITLSSTGVDFTGIATVATLKATTGIVTTLSATGNATVGGTLSVTGDVDIADKIVHTGDTDTAVRFPAADTVTVETGGSERLRIASDGKIGINTTILTEQLEVDGDVRVRNAVKFRDDNGDETGNISMGDDDNFTIQSFGTSSHITFDTGSSVTERLRIDSSGNVGIGTASPNYLTTIAGASGNAKLNLKRLNDASNGNAFGSLFYTNSDGNDVASVRAHRESATDNAYLAFATRNTGGSLTEKFRITSDGPHILLGGTADVNEITESSSNTGMVIGSTSVGNGGLAIINSTSGTGRIYFGDATGSSAARNRGQINYYHNGDYMMFATSGSERLRILSGGGLTFNGDTAAANALDDYEEGTWTAALGDDSNTTGSQTGKYTKIGDVVFLTIAIGNVNTSTLTGSQDLRVTGLPFAPVETNFRGAGTVSLDNVSFSGYVTTEISDGSYLKLVESSSGSSGDRIIVSQYTSGSGDLWISLSYKTSA